jgi:hypothetical protein
VQGERSSGAPAALRQSSRASRFQPKYPPGR